MELATTIKPIETVYNGYRFRSRLEARWAVFFDAAGVEYEYEPEGYVLNDGTNYLPDFYLPGLQLFVEIKPFLKDLSWEERLPIIEEQDDLCRRFRDSIGKAIFLVHGTPWNNVWGGLFAWDSTESGSGGACDETARFISVTYESCHMILLSHGGMDREVFVTPNGVSNKNVCTAGQLVREYPSFARNLLEEPMTRLYNPDGYDPFDVAKREAQQARFEHGEKPNVRRQAVNA